MKRRRNQRADGRTDGGNSESERAIGIMTTDPALSPDVARAIQLALAPVFLLTGIAGILNVMSGRLARIIDRGRQLVESPPGSIVLSPDKIAAELRILEQRRRLANAAITTCTLSALLVCVVIALLFVEVLLKFPLKWLEGLLFIASTLALVIGLALFLREVHLATHSMRIDLEQAAQKPPGPG
jgi:hypothetical protein